MTGRLLIGPSTGSTGVRMAEIAERVLEPDEAQAVASWAYDPPFDFYDVTGNDAARLFLTRDDAGHGYYPVLEADELVGFVCFGPEARVRGQSAEAGTCDVGAGLRPDLLSRGLATGLMPAVVAFAIARFDATRLRAAVAAFNERSIRLCTSAGFRPVREFDGPRHRRFVEMVLDIAPRSRDVPTPGSP